MFKIVPNPTFKARVSLTVPGEDALPVIDVEFRHKGRAAFAAWWESVTARTDAECLNEVIVGWSGVIDETGADVAYSLAALTQMLDRYPASAVELAGAYRKALMESRAKN